MIQYAFATLLPVSVVNTNSSWTNPNNALVEDGASATASLTGLGGSQLAMAFTAGKGIPPSASVTGLKVGGKWAYSLAGSQTAAVGDNEYILTKNATNYTAATVQSNQDAGTGLAWIYNGAAGDLWGTTWLPSDFNNGLVTGQVSVGGGGTILPGTGTVSLDAIEVVVYYTLETGEDMDFYRAAQEAGWKVLYAEALPSLSSAAAFLTSAQSGATNKASVAGTRMIVFTIRGAGITLTGDGTTPTAGAHGIDYPAGGPYMLSLNDDEAANLQAIQNGGSATGWVEYWGLP